MQSAEFLHSVWSAQPDSPGFVFISYKDEGGGWHDQSMKYPITLKGCKQALKKARVNGATDLYFCPNVFKSAKRRQDTFLPSVWLYSDLDPVDPNELPLAATTAIETSPGRYQSLWRIRKPLNGRQHAVLNQRLTYVCEADKGGWSVTKLLRIPSTKNYKRETPSDVELLWHDLQHYQVKTVVAVVKGTKIGAAVGSAKDLVIPDEDEIELLHRHKEALPKRALKLLRTTKATIGERSDRLWELECLLLDAGVSPEETFVMVRATVWNKYAGQRREIPQLWAEIQKAAAEAQSRKLGSNEGMKLISYAQFLEEPTPTQMWTVEGIWSHDAHGLIAGEPKTFKSFVAGDLAVSVASGTKFLGRFSVPEVGPVIIIQEENTPAMMKDRLEKIAYSRGLTGDVSSNGHELTYTGAPELPIYIMNNQRFNLTDKDHLALLEGWVKEIKPRLIVLDPIYLMMPGIDENSAVGLTPILRDLLMIKQKYGVGILIVHHYNKPRDADERRPGNRISGSGVFYRWFESAVYLEKGRTAGEVIMTPEHRGAAPGGSIHMEFDIGEMGELDYHVDVEVRKEVGAGALRRNIKDIVADQPGLTLQELVDALGADVSKERVQRIIDRMGYVTRRGKPDGTPGRPPLRVFHH